MLLGVRPDDDRTPPGQVTVAIPEAARRLGISEEAVRGRIKRGTLGSTKMGGRTHVLLDDRPDTDSTYDQSELVTELRTHVADLREQLEQAHERDRENRRIIAALTQRIPELEPPERTPESPVTPPEEGEKDPPPDTERRSWWRRWFER